MLKTPSVSNIQATYVLYDTFIGLLYYTHTNPGAGDLKKTHTQFKNQFFPYTTMAHEIENSFEYFAMNHKAKTHNKMQPKKKIQ